jgi:hypothetical protein
MKIANPASVIRRLIPDQLCDTAKQSLITSLGTTIATYVVIAAAAVGIAGGLNELHANRSPIRLLDRCEVKLKILMNAIDELDKFVQGQEAEIDVPPEPPVSQEPEVPRAPVIKVKELRSLCKMYASTFTHGYKAQ